MTVHIRTLTSVDSLDDLTSLLHRAYRQLADMGLRYLASHQDAAMTRKRTENGICLIAEVDSKVIGTVTVYPPAEVHGSLWLDRPDVGEIGQLAVEPKLQGRGIATRLVTEAEAVARRLGIRELALDTSEKALHLIEWYSRLGYRYIEPVDWDLTNYQSVVMSKTITQTSEKDGAEEHSDISRKDPGGSV